MSSRSYKFHAQAAATASRAEPAIPTPRSGVPTVNADNPWPGLLAFREVDRDYFQGRRTETEDLLRLVIREKLTVFFGVSGLGKSSLLQAGLFPLLRQQGILPVYIRLDFALGDPDLITQVKSAIAMQAELADIEAPASDARETLWEYLHRQDSGFWTRRNRPVTPLIAFDQFEETFTLGRLDAQRSEATEALFDQVADLAEGRTPPALKEWLDQHPENAKRFSFTRHPYKLLLSVREDFLPELERLRERMPGIALNRLRLQPMNGTAALRVVAQAEHLIDLPVAEKVVRFVAAGGDRILLDNLEVEPALLSVVCRELNTKRQSLHEPRITESLLEGSHDQVLNDFYERTVGDLPIAVRSFIEDHLLTVSGYRDSIALENALSLPGVTSESINQLVERRLLRREDRAGVQRLELTHDLLTKVVRTSRDRRHQQAQAESTRRQLLEEQEHERQLLKRQREEEDKVRAKRELRRMRGAAVVFAFLAIVAGAGLVGAIHSRAEMKKASEGERRAREEAVEQSNRAYAQSTIARQALNRIHQNLLIRQAALSGDQEKLNELLSKLTHNDIIQFAARASDLHYPLKQGEAYKFELFPEPQSLPSGKETVAFVTYLADDPTFQNTLLTAGQKRAFRVSYTGWGCLTRIVAVTEYVEPTTSPTVTVFNMCKALGDGWDQGE
jgi:hypothetical protein